MTNPQILKSFDDYGYIKLHRKILNSQVFNHEKSFRIWIWCLLKANFKTKWATLKIGKGTIEIEVKRGQFIFGRNRAAEELNMSGSTINLHMKKLVRIGNIEMKSNNQYSLITICKYDSYQSEDNGDMTTNRQVTDNQITANKQLTDTTNKEKKGENNNKEKNIQEYAQFIAILNQKTGKQFKGDSKSKHQFDLLLSDGYTLMEIEKAIGNCFADDYHQKNPQYLTPEFILREDKFEKYLNVRSNVRRPDNLKNMVF
jgi:uncharacterized phage protein (TIGR02220 family)